MKILLISAITNVSRNLGASKVTLDAADAMCSAGATCDVFPNEEIPSGCVKTALNEFIRAQKESYDVIEIPDNMNPDELEIPSDTLLVGRSVLLESHQRNIHFKEIPTTWKSRIKEFVLGSYLSKRKAQQKQERIETTENNLKKCDVINVANTRDKEVLVAQGCNPEKIMVIPYGISKQRLSELNSVKHSSGSSFNIVFLGTFDFRKGCLDIVQFFEKISEEIPLAKLKLLGTKGLIPSKEGVLAFFPRQLRNQIEVVERFSEEELPVLLSDSDVGIFPSYWEGFGIGVVEMLAAGIPVVAYDSPGPCDILPQDWLVKSGDVEGLVQKVLSVMSDKSAKRKRAKTVASQFIWEQIGEKTLQCYRMSIRNSK